MSPTTKEFKFHPQRIDVSDKDISERKAFLEFSEADVEYLIEIHRQMESRSLCDSFTDAFYQHLFSYPALQKLLPDEESIDRLKAVQAEYFERLISGSYDKDYVLGRLQVGYRHQQIGLEPKWYTGAYRKYLSSLLPILHEIYIEDQSRFQAAYDALIKIVFFDMELALDTYFHASMQDSLRLANYDALTGIPNRNLFQDRLDQELKKASRSESQLCLLLIDLDHFKEVNDTLGHWIGDLLLIEVVRRISGCVRETDTVARLGGDEFTIILSDFNDQGHIERIAQCILFELIKPFTLETNIVYISASIGITIFPDDSKDGEDLLKNADQAMYVAKSQGRNCFSYFTPAIQQKASEKLAITNDLRVAISRNELEVYYQPIVEISSGQIHKAEALLRWKHPQRGMVSPAVFIPIAEDSGLIHEIGEWVFHEVVDTIKRWYEKFGRIIQVSVNKSPIQFEKDQIVSWIDVLTRNGLPGNSITIEITEGLLLKGTNKANDQLLEYKRSGIELSIDDFGTGFSALSYLKRLDIDYLKIDRSFIMDLEQDKNDRALTEAIIVMAHKLENKTIAEGVETEAQLGLLKSFGCDYAQGFLFSRAVPAAEFEKILLQQP